MKTPAEVTTNRGAFVRSLGFDINDVVRDMSDQWIDVLARARALAAIEAYNPPTMRMEGGNAVVRVYLKPEDQDRAREAMRADLKAMDA